MRKVRLQIRSRAISLMGCEQLWLVLICVASHNIELLSLHVPFWFSLAVPFGLGAVLSMFLSFSCFSTMSAIVHTHCYTDNSQRHAHAMCECMCMYVLTHALNRHGS